MPDGGVRELRPAPELQTFQQLRLLFTDPIQHDYEVIRKVVLFGERVTTRGEETGLDRTTVAAKARRFIEKGMLGLVDDRATQAGRKPHAFPAQVASYILAPTPTRACSTPWRSRCATSRRASPGRT